MADGAAEIEGKPEYQIEFEPAGQRVHVVFNGVTVADSSQAMILRETRLAPVYYLPREDVRMELMERTDYRTHCPFKGDASYWTLVDCAWAPRERTQSRTSSRTTTWTRQANRLDYRLWRSYFVEHVRR